MDLSWESQKIIIARDLKVGRAGVADPPGGADAGATGPADGLLEVGDAFYRSLIDGMRCGVLIIARDGRLVKVNDLGRQILDLPDVAGPGTPVEEVLSDHPQLAQVLRESFNMSNLPNRAEMDLRSRSEKGKTIGFTLSLVPGSDGGPAGAAIFFKDLTHVEHKEEQERLKDRLAALGQMAANLAHEIRNPLASIEVTSSLLRRRPSIDTTARELLDKITAETRRLNRTITSSLEYVKPLSLTLAAARIEPLLDEAVTIALRRHGQPGIQVQRAYLQEMPAFLMDRSQLRQVFENLFINALEAMGASGTLRVETSTSPAPTAFASAYRAPGSASSSGPLQNFDRYVIVRVGDTGPGISEEHLGKLFYPFFTTKKQGSGVGLSMAKKIVDSHRGLIDVKNRPGGGALFTVRLPLVESQPANRGNEEVRR
jgi:signal transduction histidine kinase